jgi:predicted metal-dependent hydrolase
VSKKSARIAAMIDNLRGRDADPHYLGYFECFNQQLFYEAHDVLEELWLAQRRQANDLFYKGLIQLAGAFVHLQKERLKPAAALFRLAQANISHYPPLHEFLDVRFVLALIEDWLLELEKAGFLHNPLQFRPAPRLSLISEQVPSPLSDPALTS